MDPKSYSAKAVVFISLATLVLGALVAGAGFYVWQRSDEKPSDNVNMNVNTNSNENSVSNSSTNTVSNTTDSAADVSKEVTFKDHVLTDPVAGYKLTLPDYIQDVRLLTSEGPAVAHLQDAGKTLRYFQMTGPAQDYVAYITLGVTKDPAKISVADLIAGSPVNYLKQKNENLKQFIPVAGYKADKVVYTDNSSAYTKFVAYEINQSTLKLNATMYNPGQIGDRAITSFEKALMSLELLK